MRQSMNRETRPSSLMFWLYGGQLFLGLLVTLLSDNPLPVLVQLNLCVLVMIGARLERG